VPATDPYIPDAVPVGFRPPWLYDVQGKELAYDDDFRFNPDPVLYYAIPADGEYVLRSKTPSTAAGRISCIASPLANSVRNEHFPLGGPAGAQATVELQAGICGQQSDVGQPEQAAGHLSGLVRKDELYSNAMPFMVDTLPNVWSRKQQPTGAGQRVTLPQMVNDASSAGRHGYLRFEAGRQRNCRGGLRAEAQFAAGLLLKLTSLRPTAGNEQRLRGQGSGLLTHQADSWLRVKLPADAPTICTSRCAASGRGVWLSLADQPPGRISNCEWRVTINVRGAAPFRSPCMRAQRRLCRRNRPDLKDAPRDSL